MQPVFIPVANTINIGILLAFTISKLIILNYALALKYVHNKTQTTLENICHSKFLLCKRTLPLRAGCTIRINKLSFWTGRLLIHYFHTRYFEPLFWLDLKLLEFRSISPHYILSTTEDRFQVWAWHLSFVIFCNRLYERKYNVGHATHKCVKTS